ncbi:Protein zer-1 [Blattella germanica]|nr:Protein zer-1 [Blattella germanica]
MLPFLTVCKESVPETLLELCLKYIVDHLETICTVDPFTKDYKLKEGLALPSEICEKILQVYQQGGHILDDRFVNIFENPQTTRLQRVHIRNSSITDDGLCSLLKQKLIELDIANCSNLTEGSLVHINESCDNLLSLMIGSSVHLLPDTLYPENTHVQEGENISVYYNRGYILRTPNLRRLAVRNFIVDGEKMYFPLLLRPLHKLTYLDLSGCFDLGDLSYLCELKSLITLILYNVQRLQDAIGSLCKLGNLRHLDISQSKEKHGTFRNENQTLALLVESLPHLVSLDISGTNLAGTASKTHHGASVALTDIPGLSSRVNNPFEFLGLYGTDHEACRRHDIPAKMVSGDANETQILVAATAYTDRPDVLHKVLNDLYHLFRYGTCQNVNYALNIILEAMDRHLTEKHIQISGSATLFYIVKGKEKNLFGLFDYERLVRILLHIVSQMEQGGFVQRIGIYLLNSLACQVDGVQKQLLGDLGAINQILTLIEDRLERKVFDDALEVAWSTMWNVTDETAINCQRFLDGRGMEFFLGCLSTFPDKEELIRNMMGLLGNVAEVTLLRHRLMTSQFVSVSYNAAGVLSHMASDGPAAWSLKSPRREDVLQRMVAAIERWDLHTERNINYRSFEPILYLSKIYHTPECQHWAVWALANLTKVYQGGLHILEEIIHNDKPYERIKELAAMVLLHCQNHREKAMDTDAPLDG